MSEVFPMVNTTLPVWRLRALTSVLSISLFFILILTVSNIFSAILASTPTWQLMIVMIFAVLLLSARLLVSRWYFLATGLLFAIIWGGAMSVKFYTSSPKVADFSLVFVYSLPFLSLVFVGRRTAIATSILNVFPFLFVQYLEYRQSLSIIDELENGFIYIHSLIFMFFNIALPFACYSMTKAALDYGREQNRLQIMQASRQKIYQTLFEESTVPKFIAKPSQLKVVDVNNVLKQEFGDQCSALTTQVMTVLADSPSSPKDHYIKLGDRSYRFHSRAIAKTSNWLITFEDVTEIRNLKRALKRENESNISRQFFDKDTGLPNQSALLAYIDKRPELIEDGYLVSVKPELSELSSTRLSDPLFFEQQIAYAQCLQSIFKGCFLAKISRHTFVLVFRQKNEAAAMQFINSGRFKLHNKPLPVDSKFHYQSKFAVSKVGQDDMDLNYLIDKTQEFLLKDISSVEVVRYQPSHDTVSEERVKLRSDLESAITNEGLFIMLQPKVDSTGRLFEFESLVRWQNNGKTIPPSHFIPLAEQFGLICRLTDWLMEHVCQFIAKQVKEQTAVVPISVNISAHDLKREDFVQVIRRLLTKYAIPVGLFGIELTETSLLDQKQDVIDRLKQIRAMGIIVSIDDFGVGYSSLSRIVDLPIDVLKLDRSFLTNLTQDRKRFILINAIVGLCKELNIEVVAEGIESVEDYKMLNELGGMSYQGYYFSKPLRVDEAIALLHTANDNEGVTLPFRVR